MGKKKDNDIIVTFLGESRNDVTGSSVLINYPKKNNKRGNILIEMGINQGAFNIEKGLANNREMLSRFNKDLIESIDTVFLLHPHCDHVASIPYLNNGFDGRIITTKALSIVKDLVENSVDIHLGEIQTLKATKGKKVKPLYTKQDMYEIFDKMESVETYNKYKLNDEVEYRFIDSGHVLGGCMLELWIRKPNNSVKHIVYTSDMGSDYNNEFQYFVPKREQISKCNLLITEATYNSPERSWTRKDAIKERKILKQEIKKYLNEDKEILFSSFSFGRLQNIMCMLYDFFHEEDWFNNIPIILDGCLMHKINSDYLNILEGEELEYFKKVMSWSNMKMNKTFDGTKAILSKKEPRIIISTSGFLTNGRIVSYLQHMVGSKKSVIYLTGYCGSKDSLGGQMLDENIKVLNINKQSIVKKAKIKKLSTFSSHIQFDELINLCKSVNCEKIIIHHSSKEEKESFKKSVIEEIRNIGKTTKIDIATDKNYQFII